ncbi:MAG: hypothetical protein COA58_08565 [Bacteroidetes bacterium]|nr:MAG: hypothetical protein COA58_08565 [Bacteroidota bacterium]
MNNKLYFKRFGTFAFAFVMFMGVSFAEGGDDDDKKGNKSNKGDKVILTDSIVLDVDFKGDMTNNSDDTLVFEDWENPDDLDLGGGSPLGGDNGISSNGNGNGISTTSLLDAAGQVAFGNTFKKNYHVDFTLFPNPTVNEIHIKPSIEPSSIRIADITGKEHLKALFTPRVDVAQLPAGTYFIQLIYADHIEARKFIKS